MITRTGSTQVVVVDPGDAQVVQQVLNKGGLELVAILVTHHHGDHTGGVKELTTRHPGAIVYGPVRENIPGVQYKVQEGDTVDIPALNLSMKVLDVPGHTAGHIAYFSTTDTCPTLFCGDTLFSVGCGRIFEGTAEQLHNSLKKLAELPGNTQVYCAHEYTLTNIKFALHSMPANKALLKHEKIAQQLCSKHLPSLPSTIELECNINPFLRLDKKDVIAATEQFAGRKLTNSVQVFTYLRKWKDIF